MAGTASNRPSGVQLNYVARVGIRSFIQVGEREVRESEVSERDVRELEVGKRVLVLECPKLGLIGPPWLADLNHGGRTTVVG